MALGVGGTVHFSCGACLQGARTELGRISALPENVNKTSTFEKHFKARVEEVPQCPVGSLPWQWLQVILSVTQAGRALSGWDGPGGSLEDEDWAASGRVRKLGAVKEGLPDGTEGARWRIWGSREACLAEGLSEAPTCLPSEV